MRGMTEEEANRAQSELDALMREVNESDVPREGIGMELFKRLNDVALSRISTPGATAKLVDETAAWVDNVIVPRSLAESKDEYGWKRLYDQVMAFCRRWQKPAN